jgi:PPE-repeat protein
MLLKPGRESYSVPRQLSTLAKEKTMPSLRPLVILGCSLAGAGAIALAVPATASAENCLLGIRGLVCTNGILNSDVVPGFPSVGIGNSGGLNGGILNSGVGNVGVLNSGIGNQGIGNNGTANQGILNGGTAQQGILNFGGGSLVGLAPGGHLLGIGG